MNKTELYNKLLTFLDTNDEQGAKDFLIEHLNDFPEEMRDKIVFYFFSEAVEKEMAIEQIKKEGLDLLKKIDQEEQVIHDQQNIKDLKKDILS